MNIQKIKEFFKIISVPLILICMYLLVYVLWLFFDLPTDEELVVIVKEWFAIYGLWIVFFGALIEGFLLLGQYFPGGFIIFLGVISSVGNILQAVKVVAIVCISFFIAYSLNYVVGRYGWYKLFEKLGLAHSIDNSKNKIMKQGTNVIFFSYWEPNLASITATAAGVLKVPFVKFSFYSSLGIILWNIFWGVLVYSLGESALKIMGLTWILIIFGVWILVLLLKKYFSNKKLIR